MGTETKTAYLPWLWPDRTIGESESRVLREAHNRLVNSHADLLEACDLALTELESLNKHFYRDGEWESVKTLRAAIRKARGEA